MKRLAYFILAPALLLMSGYISSFVFSGYGAIKERPLVEGLSSTSDAVKALEALDAAEIDRLIQRETEALKKEPLDRGALENLLVLENLRGSKEKVAALATTLANFSPRNPKSQLAAMKIEFDSQDFDSAYNRLDGILRARPELSYQLFPVLLSQITNEKARAALGKVLTGNPPWRTAFITKVASDDTSGTLGYRILSEIRKAKGEVDDEEKRQLIQRLYIAKKYDQAYFIWLDLLSKDSLLKVKNVFDGGFDLPPKGHVFDWNFNFRKTARIEVGPRSGKNNDIALRLDFFNDKEGGYYAYQVLRLSPDTYEMNFDVQVEDLKSSTGVVWRLICVESRNFIGQSSAVTDKGPWETRQFEFTVPGQDCATQFLSLEVKGSAVLDQVITGRLSFDNLDIKTKAVTKKKDAVKKTTP
jgi:hypothetical protein